MHQAPTSTHHVQRAMWSVWAATTCAVLTFWCADEVYAQTPRAPRTRGDDALARPEDTTRPVPLRDSVVWRLGPSFHGMFGSAQGRPFVYPTLGVRYKAGEVYADAQLTALFGGMDAAQYYARREWIDANAAFTLFESLNTTRHYAFIEAMRLRVARAWDSPWTSGGSTRPIRLAAGASVSADWAIFEAPTLAGPLEDISDETVAQDPGVLGVGVFGAIVLGLPSTHLDLSLGIARDIADVTDYAPVRGWILDAELDVQLDIYGDWGAFARARVATYTHPRGRLAWGMTSAFGVAFRLF